MEIIKAKFIWLTHLIVYYIFSLCCVLHFPALCRVLPNFPMYYDLVMGILFDSLDLGDSEKMACRHRATDHFSDYSEYLNLNLSSQTVSRHHRDQSLFV